MLIEFGERLLQERGSWQFAFFSWLSTNGVKLDVSVRRVHGSRITVDGKEGWPRNLPEFNALWRAYLDGRTPRHAESELPPGVVLPQDC